jgi:pyruvate,water dikinase
MMERGGLSPLEAGLAVIVQRAVETVAAGVLVSRDPVRGPDTLLVNAAWGLGEGISQGVVPGDLFWVRRSTGERLAWERGVTARQVVLDVAASGTLEVDLPEERATRPCLGFDELRRLAALARALDASGRAIREVEFGFGPDGTLYVFQARPAVRRAEAT